MRLPTALESFRLHSHITRQKGVCGGSPVVRGTRIRVIDIAIESDRLGCSPDDIANGHPGLTLEQVHDALSYYAKNNKQLDAEIRERAKRVAALKTAYPRFLKSTHARN
ncbi:MAG: DUF433 domain-containing protein [Nitrospirota bacterium]